MVQHAARLFAANSHPAFAQEVSQILDIPLGSRTLKHFKCGEIYVNYDETVRGKHVFIIGTIRPGRHLHEDMMEIFLMCDAAKRSFAHSVHVVLPHISYARQDKIHSARESISMKLVADLLTTSGCDHLITMHLHADQSQAFFDIPVDNLTPRRHFTKYVQALEIDNPIVISPDAGGAKQAKKFADTLGYDLAILHKTRSAHNESQVTHVIGDVAGRTPIILDDIIDTGGSVIGAKNALIEAGSQPEVYLVATHPIFSDPAPQLLRDAGFAEIITTNSIPHDNLQIPNYTQLSMAPLIAQVIGNVLEERSVSELYF